MTDVKGTNQMDIRIKTCANNTVKRDMKLRVHVALQ